MPFVLELNQALYPIRALLEAGGEVLELIFAVSLVLWTLIVARYLDLLWGHPRRLAQVEAAWVARPERSSWCAHQIRRALISELALGLSRSLHWIKALIAICPLLGLLGTVTGMIHVFDLMRLEGRDHVKALAEGVSLATIPTMAGMLVAVSALFFSADLQRRAVRETQHVAERLRLDR